MAGSPALRGVSELVNGESLCQPDQLEVAVDRIWACLAGGVCEKCRVRKADLPCYDGVVSIGHRGQLGIDAHIARCV